MAHHAGDLRFGHYVAECNVSGKWYVFDDERVSSTSGPSNNRPSAYVLFYKLIN